MWVDRGLYWKWEGGAEGFCQPPEKTIEYAAIGPMRLAVAVVNEGVRTEVNQDELRFLRKVS